MAQYRGSSTQAAAVKLPPLANLPRELFYDRILSKLPILDVLSLSSTNHAFRNSVLNHYGIFDRVIVSAKDISTSTPPARQIAALERVGPRIHHLYLPLEESDNKPYGAQIPRPSFFLNLHNLATLELSSYHNSYSPHITRRTWIALASLPHLTTLRLFGSIDFCTPRSEQSGIPTYFELPKLENFIVCSEYFYPQANHFWPPIFQTEDDDRTRNRILPSLKYLETNAPGLFGQIYHSCNQLEDICSERWNEQDKDGQHVEPRITWEMQYKIAKELGEKPIKRFCFRFRDYRFMAAQVARLVRCLRNVEVLEFYGPKADLEIKNDWSGVPGAKDFFHLGNASGNTLLALYAELFGDLPCLRSLVIHDPVDICYFYGTALWRAEDFNALEVHILRKRFIAYIVYHCPNFEQFVFHGPMGHHYSATTVTYTLLPCRKSVIVEVDDKPSLNERGRLLARGVLGEQELELDNVPSVSMEFREEVMLDHICENEECACFDHTPRPSPVIYPTIPTSWDGEMVVGRIARGMDGDPPDDEGEDLDMKQLEEEEQLFGGLTKDLEFQWLDVEEKREVVYMELDAARQGGPVVVFEVDAYMEDARDFLL